MRVVSGSARGCKLQPVPGMSTRPTTDRVKENVFNLIQEHVRGAEVLDLFAGTGQLGIEALSRGARHCDFVERDKAAYISCVKIQKPPAWPTAPRCTGKRRPTLFPMPESGDTA